MTFEEAQKELEEIVRRLETGEAPLDEALKLWQRGEELYRLCKEQLDSAEEIAYISRILEEGSGADRQLRVFAETGDLKRVVDYIIEQTEIGIFEPAGTSRAGSI